MAEQTVEETKDTSTQQEAPQDSASVTVGTTGQTEQAGGADDLDFERAKTDPDYLDAFNAKLRQAKPEQAEAPAQASEQKEEAAATDDKWDDVVKEVDLAWNDFKASAEGVYDALKKHTKN